MKFIKVLIILAGLLIVLGAITNIYYLAQADKPIFGIYLDLGALVVLLIAIVIIYITERKQKTGGNK